MKLISILCTLGTTISLNLAAQVTMGNNEMPEKGALLQLKSINNISDGSANANAGLILPRVELVGLPDAIMQSGTNQTDFTDQTLEHIGLTVYNLTNKPEIGLCPGVYVWEDGSQWVKLGEACASARTPINSENSFIVSSSATEPLLIPAGKPYIVWKDRADLGNIDLTGSVSVELLWQDTPSLIKSVALLNGDEGAYSQIQVTTAGNGTVGNAVVAIHIGPNGDNTDPIYWSWHIWVSDNVGTYAGNNSEQDYIFMDRNLGATTTEQNVQAMGLLYQWGRKDPFTSATSYVSTSTRTLYDINNTVLTEVDEYDPATPAGTGIHHAIVTASNNMINAVQNPTTFYFQGYDNGLQTTGDWYTTDNTGATGDANLWGADGTKSVFDPCPEGWRVPTNSTSGISPWYQFEASPTNIMSVSPASFNSYGAVLTARTGVAELGYYPYGLTRMPRETSPCGYNGSSTDHTVGGTFGCFEILNEFTSLYWIANPVASTTTAKSEFFKYSTGGMMMGGKIYMENNAKATGARVRCVKISQ